MGVAGLVRMLPAALIAPFAASLGDRFRRERFLVSIALVGAAALAASAVVFFVSENAPAIFALAAVVGLAATLVRPAQQALLPSLARTPEELIGANGATSTIESLGTLIGPLLAGVLVSIADAGVVFAVGAGALLVSALLFFRVRVEGRLHAASVAGDGARPPGAYGGPCIRRTGADAAHDRRARRRTSFRPRLSQRPDRGHRVPRPRRKRGCRRLYDRRPRGGRPDRRASRVQARGTPTRRRVRNCAHPLGASNRADGIFVLPRNGAPSPRGGRRGQLDRGRGRVHAPPAHRSRRRPHPRPRRPLGPGDGRRRSRLDHRPRRCEASSVPARRTRRCRRNPPGAYAAGVASARRNRPEHAWPDRRAGSDRFSANADAALAGGKGALGDGTGSHERPDRRRRHPCRRNG